MSTVKMNINDETIAELYHAVNHMMGILGQDGEVHTTQVCVTRVMDALHSIDGGVYNASAYPVLARSKTDKAADALYAALKQCADAGLMGGVYFGVFCAWPKSAEHPHEGPHDFFENVEMIGGFVLATNHGMSLDGGAGN